MLKAINLSLSSACGAKCIFCPADRGEANKNVSMPLVIAQKIIDEVASDTFTSQHAITTIRVGENGDCFLNESVVEILRYIRSKLPHVRIPITTNFQHFTPERIDILLQERLVDAIICNIDGSNDQSYFNVKRIRLQRVQDHISYFIKKRRELGDNVPITMNVLSLTEYVSEMKRHLGGIPTKLKIVGGNDAEAEYLATRDIWQQILDSAQDRIVRVNDPMFWAEREKSSLRPEEYEDYDCPQFDRVLHEAFISPDGNWYICCNDSKNETTLGNVYEQSVQAVYAGERRAQVIKLLTNRQYGVIGGPCKTVHCCHSAPQTRAHKFAVKVKRQAPFLYRLAKSFKKCFQTHPFSHE